MKTTREKTRRGHERVIKEYANGNIIATSVVPRSFEWRGGTYQAAALGRTTLGGMRCWSCAYSFNGRLQCAMFTLWKKSDVMRFVRKYTR